MKIYFAILLRQKCYEINIDDISNAEIRMKVKLTSFVIAGHRCLHKCNSELFICLHEFRMNMSLQCWKQIY